MVTSTASRPGRPVNLRKIARRMVRASGDKWLAELQRQADLGDAPAIGTLLSFALEPAATPTTPAPAGRA